MQHDIQNSSKAIAQRLSTLTEDLSKATNKEAADAIKLLDAFLIVKGYLSEVVKNISESDLQITVRKDDANGWPCFQMLAHFGEEEVGKLVIGAQSRRTGPVMFFRNTHLDRSVELKTSQFSNVDELNRTLKRNFREFVDELEDSIVKGIENGSYDKEEEMELSLLDLGGDSESTQAERKQVEASSAGICLDPSMTEDLEEELSLDGLDLFAE